MENARAGVYVKQVGGYRAFLPSPLPPDPPLSMDNGMITALSAADRALGRLDGASEVLPTPDLFIAMYVRRESVLSSQIEGTQASLADVLEYEADAARKGLPADIEEVVNHIGAMKYGLRRLDELPVSLRLIREIHERLMANVRGGQMSPGEFRTTQNWIGPHGSTLNSATYVPPPPHEMMGALDRLEAFLHTADHFPALIHAGLVHAQFETIHPFLDGNGRIGRLLTTFLLCQRRVLRQPLLYLSHHFKLHQNEYYDHLTAIRETGDWEGWIKFFLVGVANVANQATDTAREILRLRESHRLLLSDRIQTNNALRLLDYLYEQPMVTVSLAAKALTVSVPTANSLVGQFCETGLLTEISGGRRNRIFSYQPYLHLFEDQALDEALQEEPGSKRDAVTIEADPAEAPTEFDNV